jgi:hypothetical protein
MDKELTEEKKQEVRKADAEFQCAWNHLRNALELIELGVYLESEINIPGLKQKVRQKHDRLIDLGYGKA